jgi:2-methylcitrate dehydratase PrpD
MRVPATRRLAAFAAGRDAGDLPEETARAGRRAVANAIALAAAASSHPAVTRVLDVASALGGPQQATVLGTDVRLPMQWAALVNGMAIHVEDFDDTHLQTVIHPAAPVVPAALAVAEAKALSGAQFLTAVVVGMEVALRVGVGVCPGHFDRGWHVTGTTGHFGAAAAASRLLGLDAGATARAMGIAGTQAAGLQVALGSMTKAFHPGKAAADGVEAALLAARGFTGPTDVLEGHRGFGEVTAPAPDYLAMVDDLGERWETERNAFKPYACGIVSHPAIDAAIALRDAVGPVERVARIDVRVHPVVLDVMGVKAPERGLEGKFSVFHCVAVGLLDGAASLAQYSDERVRDPAVRRLRDLVHAQPDGAIAKDEARMSVQLTDGTRLEHHVAHATGSESRPLTDGELRDKVALLHAGAEPAAGDLMDVVMGVDELPRLDELLAAARSFSLAKPPATAA